MKLLKPPFLKAKNDDLYKQRQDCIDARLSRIPSHIAAPIGSDAVEFGSSASVAAGTGRSPGYESD